ncbi:hypothetical protein NX862_01935 [Rhodobacter sp. KR11]|uniref:hypothetical protein n=1 Tax=Rhodobacter sp. KR11 TaxID=2974588 RepID=UPI002222118D|nr:hypothetical protein [Rhodobacter sp. KR11]MCW1917505.1 hypothetical protein [Rhodobacter sp. KR11]
MLSHGKAFLLATATATAIFFPVCSQAATILRLNALTANQTFTGAEVIRPGDTLEFRFTALEDLMIDAFSLSGTGNNTEADLRDIRFGLTLPPTGFFNPVSSDGTAAAGIGFLTGGTFLMGSVFSIYFQDGISDDVGITLSFRTDPVAVPLPAAGLLLAPMMGLAGVVARRRRKALAG